MGRSAAANALPLGFHAPRRGVLAGIAVLVVALHAWVLSGLPPVTGPGAGPAATATTAAGARPLAVRQIVAPGGEPTRAPPAARAAPDRAPAAAVTAAVVGGPQAAVPPRPPTVTTPAPAGAGSRVAGIADAPVGSSSRAPSPSLTRSPSPTTGPGPAAPEPVGRAVPGTPDELDADAPGAPAARPPGRAGTAVPTAVSTAVVTDLAAGGRPLPLYPARPPAAARLVFELRRGAASGSAQLRWRPAAEAPRALDAAAAASAGPRYELDLSGRLGSAEVLGWASRGRLTGTGLAPERFVIRRRGRDRLAVNFDRDAGRITFSGPAVELPLVAGVQDRASWLVQLPAVIEADPARAVPGAVTELLVVGARGDAAVWAFTALEPERIEWAGGVVERAPRLRREAVQPYDTTVEVWLDPARSHLPLRVRWSNRPGAESTELVLTSAER